MANFFPRRPASHPARGACRRNGGGSGRALRGGLAPPNSSAERTRVPALPLPPPCARPGSAGAAIGIRLRPAPPVPQGRAGRRERLPGSEPAPSRPAPPRPPPPGARPPSLPSPRSRQGPGRGLRNAAGAAPFCFAFSPAAEDEEPPGAVSAGSGRPGDEERRAPAFHPLSAPGPRPALPVGRGLRPPARGSPTRPLAPRVGPMLGDPSAGEARGLPGPPASCVGTGPPAGPGRPGARRSVWPPSPSPCVCARGVVIPGAVPSRRWSGACERLREAAGGGTAPHGTARLRSGDPPLLGGSVRCPVPVTRGVLVPGDEMSRRG